MAHAYTPGLKVLHQSDVSKNRRLPIKGEVVKNIGDNVSPEMVVAKTDLPGNVQMVRYQICLILAQETLMML